MPRTVSRSADSGRTWNGGYHYHLPRDQVRRRLATAGFTSTEETDADNYWHLMLTR